LASGGKYKNFADFKLAKGMFLDWFREKERE
jgi:hypothetical protein